jgi:CRISPR/Cas system CSM-associated protein Csm3 (group 7 of RAMP superfamily)
METLQIEGQLTALSKIHTGGNDKTGIHTMMRKEEYLMVNGETERVPIIPGSGIRGNLRRLLLRDFFEQAEYTIKTPKLFYLFSGGALENVDSRDSGTLSLSLRRTVRSSLHPLSLLGASMGNQAFAGKLCVSDASLVCCELNDFHPLQSTVSYHNHVAWTFATRRAEREVPLEVEQALTEKQKTQVEPTIQMKVNIEYLMPGSKFYHKFTLMDTSLLEKSCFARMIELWRERPFVGGKSNVGYGEVKLDYPKIAWSSKEYLDWVHDNKVEVQRVLEQLDK